MKGTQEYTVDPTLLKTERVEIDLAPVGATSQVQRATQLKLDEVPLAKNNSLVNGSTLFNVGYYLAGSQSAQKIGFIPVPQVTGTNNINVWGIVAPIDLINTTDPVCIPYPDNFSQIIVKLAAGNLLKKGGQEVLAGNDLLTEASADILNMQTFLKERQSDGIPMIEEGAFEDVNPSSYIY
jgi:hypothetical protein